jgi:alpha-1,6-mannosyltransferase
LKVGARGRLAALGCGLVLLNIVGLGLQDRGNQAGLLVVLLLEGGLYLAAVFCLMRSAKGGRLLPFILVVAALLRIGPLLFPPFLSTDIYRYVWDGRVQGAGINPYRYIPSDEALAGLRDAAIYPNINRVGYARTIYPPVAELIFLGVTRLSERLTAMKLAMVVFEAGMVFLIVLLLRRGGAPPERVLIYAWHPLAVWEISGSGHIDAALCFFLTLALMARFRNMPATTGVALAAGALIKFFPVLLAPSLYRRWDWRLPVGLASVIMLLYLPYLSVGWHVLGFLPSYFVEERFASGSGFYFIDLISYLFGLSSPPVAIYFGLAAVVLITSAFVLFWRPMTGTFGFAAGALLLSLLLLVFVTPHYPWYFLWLLPLLCLIPYWPALLLTSASFILYATLGLQPPARGLAVNSLLYGPFLLAAAIHLCVHRRWWRGLPGGQAEGAVHE